MTPVITWSNSAAAAITVLRGELPARTEPYAAAAAVHAHIPDDRTAVSDSPLVMVRPDGATVDSLLDQRATVRVTCWHDSEFEAMALAGLCQALLVAHTGAEIASVEFAAGPVPGLDPDNGRPLATATVLAHIRPST